MSDFDPFGDPPRPSQSTPSSSPWDAVVARIASNNSAPADADAAEGSSTQEPRHPVGRVLVVCTGNVCRSPYIELTLQRELEGTGLEVTSAGTGALVDNPVDDGSQRLLDALGIAYEDFRARQLEPEMVREADLVLTATREHRSEVVRSARTGLDKTFAVIDFAELVQDLHENDIAHARGVNPCARLTEAARLHRPKVHMRIDGADIPDPFRRGPREFSTMQRVTDPAVSTVARALRLAIAQAQ